jgi:hypothetical protein
VAVNENCILYSSESYQRKAVVTFLEKSTLQKQATHISEGEVCARITIANKLAQNQQIFLGTCKRIGGVLEKMIY